MGDKPIQMELLSDPDEGKADGFSYASSSVQWPQIYDMRCLSDSLQSIMKTPTSMSAFQCSPSMATMTILKVQARSVLLIDASLVAL